MWSRVLWLTVLHPYLGMLFSLLDYPKAKMFSCTLNSLAIWEFDEWELVREVSTPVSLEKRIPTMAFDAFLSQFSFWSLSFLICKFRGFNDWVLALTISLPEFSGPLPLILQVLQCYLIRKVILNHHIKVFSSALSAAAFSFPFFCFIFLRPLITTSIDIFI